MSSSFQIAASFRKRGAESLGKFIIDNVVHRFDSNSGGGLSHFISSLVTRLWADSIHPGGNRKQGASAFGLERNEFLLDVLRAAKLIPLSLIRFNRKVETS